MKKCPRCQQGLVKSSKKSFVSNDGPAILDDVLYCVNGDGILLSLKQMERRTSRFFIQHFWIYWKKMVRKKSFKCPECAASMETLNDSMNSDLELDCCPHCFSLWLDAGEDERLHQFFISKYTEAREGPGFAGKLSEDQFQILAKAIAEHEATMLKYERMAGLGSLLTQNISIFSRFRAFF